MIKHPLLFDEEIENPQHDTIMMWLNDNIEIIIPNMFCYAEEWNDKVDWWKQQAQGFVQSTYNQLKEVGWCDKGRTPYWKQYWDNETDFHDHFNSFTGLPDLPLKDIMIDDISWQVPIRDDSSSIIGFADMVAYYDIPDMSLSNIKDGVLKEPTQFPKWKTSFSQLRTVFDVRVCINSLNKLIRTWKLYATYLSQSDIVIVCPDDRFAKRLNAQGFYFVKYPL